MLVICVAASTAFAQEADGEAVDKQAFDKAFGEGKALFEKGDFTRAYPHLVDAFKEHPGDVGANFYLGRAAFETGDYESAVMAFERVLMLDPDLERAKLELARSYYRLGVLEMAKMYFQEVLDTGPPEPVQRNIDAFLQRIERARQRHFLSGVVTFGFHWDSNVRVSPESNTVQTSIGSVELDAESREKQDTLFAVTVALNHRYKAPDSPLAWKTTGLTYHALYDDEHDLDINYYNLTSGPSIENERHLIDFQLVAESLDKEYDHYLQALGLQTNFLKALSQKVYLAAGARLVDKEYDQAPKRDALNGSLTLGPIFAWGPNRITTRFGFEKESAEASADFEDDEHSYEKLTASIRYDRALPARFGVYAGYRFQHVDYDARYATFDQNRRDQIHECSVGLTRKFTDRTTMEVGHTYTESRSSIDLYRYDRRVTTVSVTTNF